MLSAAVEVFLLSIESTSWEIFKEVLCINTRDRDIWSQVRQVQLYGLWCSMTQYQWNSVRTGFAEYAYRRNCLVNRNPDIVVEMTLHVGIK
jgi:hypothetical protein